MQRAPDLLLAAALRTAWHVRAAPLRTDCLLSAPAPARSMGKHHLCNPDDKTLEEFNKCYHEKKHGPLDAVHDFLAEEPEGVWQQDKQREYMLYSQHADGWLQRLE